jgi:Ethanolamine utilization protein EutJ (predicted chaperonin)
METPPLCSLCGRRASERTAFVKSELTGYPPVMVVCASPFHDAGDWGPALRGALTDLMDEVDDVPRSLETSECFESWKACKAALSAPPGELAREVREVLKYYANDGMYVQMAVDGVASPAGAKAREVLAKMGGEG